MYTRYFVAELSVSNEHFEEFSNIHARYDQATHDGLLNDPTNPFADESEVEDMRSGKEVRGYHLNKLARQAK